LVGRRAHASPAAGCGVIIQAGGRCHDVHSGALGSRRLVDDPRNRSGLVDDICGASYTVGCHAVAGRGDLTATTAKGSGVFHLDVGGGSRLDDGSAMLAAIRWNCFPRIEVVISTIRIVEGNSALVGR